MALTDDDAKKVWRSDIIPSPDKAATNPCWQADSYLRETYLAVQAARAEVAGLVAAVNALSTSQGVDPAIVTKAVTDAVNAAVAHLDLRIVPGGAQ